MSSFSSSFPAHRGTFTPLLLLFLSLVCPTPHTSPVEDCCCGPLSALRHLLLIIVSSLPVLFSLPLNIKFRPSVYTHTHIHTGICLGGVCRLRGRRESEKNKERLQRRARSMMMMMWTKCFPQSNTRTRRLFVEDGGGSAVDGRGHGGGYHHGARVVGRRAAI